MNEPDAQFIFTIAATVLSALRKRAALRIAVGAVVLLIGIGATADSYDSPDALGYYTVYYGAFIVGALILISGIYRFATAPRMAIAEAHARWIVWSSVIREREQEQ